MFKQYFTLILGCGWVLIGLKFSQCHLSYAEPEAIFVKSEKHPHCCVRGGVQSAVLLEPFKKTKKNPTNKQKYSNLLPNLRHWVSRQGTAVWWWSGPKFRQGRRQNCVFKKKWARLIKHEYQNKSEASRAKTKVKPKLEKLNYDQSVITMITDTSINQGRARKYDVQEHETWTQPEQNTWWRNTDDLTMTKRKHKDQIHTEVIWGSGNIWGKQLTQLNVMTQQGKVH